MIKKVGYLKENARLASIFFGGGTPSKMPTDFFHKAINKILLHLESHIARNFIIEISIEANPESINLEKLNAYKSAGINRLSIGIQTTQEKHIRYLGRNYSKSKYNALLQLIENSPIENINLDFIYGLPKQNLRDVLKDLELFSDLPISHLSAYCLSVEKGTQLHHDIKKKTKPAPSEKRALLQMNGVRDFLISKGFDYYEISNFARNNKKCLHNLIYWKFRQYIGLGPAAHSFVDGRRFINSHNVTEYLTDTIFNSSNAQDNIDIFIGSTRLLDRQSFSRFRKHLSERQLSKFKIHLERLHKEEKVTLAKNSFQYLPSAVTFSDDILLKLVDDADA